MAEYTILMKQYDGNLYNNLYPYTISTNMLLSSSTAAMFDVQTVDDALRALYYSQLGTKGIVTLTIQTPSGSPISGLIFDGYYDINNNIAVTNSSGVVSIVLEEGSQTITLNDYADISISEEVQVIAQQEIKKTISTEPINFAQYNSSTEIRISSLATRLDISCAGGGGAGSTGGTSFALFSGSGGGGGYATTQEQVGFTPNEKISVIVGIGGQSAGTSGGSSSMLGVVAQGGAGGTPPNAPTSTIAVGGIGNGNGGNGVSTSQLNTYINGLNGSSGNQTIYSSFTSVITIGGGGGGGACRYISNGNGGPGGSPNGGTGSGADSYTSTALMDGKSPSGGGGGGSVNTGGSGAVETYYGKGAHGRVAIRIYH